MKHRKKYSIPGNLLFVFKKINGWDKKTVPFILLQSPLNAVFSLATTFFAPALIYLIKKDAGVICIMLTALGFLLLLFITDFLQAKFKTASADCFKDCSLKMAVEMTEKFMNMDYDLLEGPEGRDKYQKAQNSLRRCDMENYLYRVIAFFTSLLGFSAYSAIIGMLSPWLILIIIAAQAIGGLGQMIGSKLANTLNEDIAKNDRHLGYMQKVSGDFQISKDIRIYGMSDFLLGMTGVFMKRKKELANKRKQHYASTDMIGMIVGTLLKGAIYGYLVYKIVSSGMSAANVVLYAGVMIGFSEWIGKLFQSASQVFDNSIQISNYREFMDMENTMKNSGGVETPRDEPYEIEVKNVTFFYPGSDRKILDDVSFTIRAGEHFALVGKNGAGKTTLVKLICGLYRPTEGQILINGVDIRDMNRDEYYQKLSVVFQDAKILPMSIKSNISQTIDEETDNDLVNKCIILSGLASKVESLKNGTDTELVKTVCENGVELSGGETQKLLLARAIYKQAPVLILDEPTAALDPIAENEMYLKYRELSYNRTALYISHRLSSTRFCDKIIFLDDAIIAETGTHDELMELGGKYAEMFEIQSKYYQRRDVYAEA